MFREREVDPKPYVFVIHNPAAGMRRPGRVRRRIESTLSSRGIPFDYAYTEEPGHGSELVAGALARGFQRILVAGGDGTVREAVAALAGKDAALALIPVGTGNQLAANLGVPKRFSHSLHVALSGGLRRIDLGLVDGRPFTSIAGAGFDAEVVRPGSRLKRRVGFLAYVHSAARAVLAPRPVELRVEVDGTVMQGRGIGVEVTNMPGLTAPGLRRPVPIVPAGKMDDGQLDGCLVAAETTLDCLSALGSILRRKYGRDRRLRYFSGRSIAVHADPPLRVQADGELLGLTPFTIRVWPQALSVMVPAAMAATNNA